MTFKDPWQLQMGDLLSASCCSCDRTLSQDYGILFCQHCWQRPADVCQPRILAVDDDPDSLLFISMALESFGLPYVSLPEGLGSVAFLQQYQADLILLDALLADIDSQALLQSLRRNVVTQTIPVVVVTAWASPDDRRRLLAAGFNDYLSKPYQLDNLKAVIMRNLPPPL